MPEPPICDYEGSDYQISFWEHGGREYEDRVEAIALGRLLPKGGRLLLELGAGAGRNTARYTGFERIVLLDYSYNQLQQAQARLGRSTRYIYVAADAYRLPFVENLFDAATMIRTLHHMADPQRALNQVRLALGSKARFILEYANKQNTKAILRYWLHQQSWNPFAIEPVEFAELNYDFHPAAIRQWLEQLDFCIKRILSVSHFRIGMVKRFLPIPVLVTMDSLLQWTGGLWQLTPSVFIGADLSKPIASVTGIPSTISGYFKCLECQVPGMRETADYLECTNCSRRWGFRDGIYDFRQPQAV